MRLKLTLLTTLLLVVAKSWGWSVGDQFEVSGIKYQITDLEKYYVTAIEVSTDALGEEPNKVIIPATVKDPYDVSKTFTITQIRLQDTNNEKIKVLELEKGDKLVFVTGLQGAHFEEVILPSNVYSINAWDGYVDKFTFIDNSMFYVDSIDGEVYKKLDEGGLEQVYHFRGNKSRINENGVYEIKEGVTYVRPANFTDPIITGIKFSSSVTDFYINNAAPMGSSNILEYSVAEGSKYFKAVDGVLYDKVDTTLYLYPLGRNTVCSTFPVFKLPDTVKRVMKNSLRGFQGRVIDLNNVAEIGDEAIIATSIDTLKIGKYLQDLTGIEANSQLKSIIIDEENPYMQSIDGVVFSKDKTSLIHYPKAMTGDYKLPKGVKKIESKAFRDFNTKNTTASMIICNAELEEIGDMAFHGAKVVSIDFSNCNNLKTIGNEAFRYIIGMTEFTLPASMEKIEKGIFSKSPFEKIIIPAGSKLDTIGASAFVDINKYTEKVFTTLEINPNCPLETIETKAFYGCKGLTSIALPKTVTTIGASAFSGCTALEKVTFAENAAITTIGANAFEFSGIKSISIPEGVTTIDKEAFSTCDVLTEVTLPSSLTSMSGEAFKFCSKLANVYVADGNTNYSSINGILLNKDKTTLVLFPPAKANDKFTLLPPSITTLGDYAFYTCTNLKNVVIPNKVTSIGERTFGLCSNLNSITFLCDNMIPSDNINQAQNEVAFDATMFKNIDIHVRKEKLNDYKKEEFYKQFKSITPSFASGTEEYIKVSENSVSLLSTTSGNSTFVVPKSVDYSGATYNVSMIGDYCLQNAPATMKEVVVSENVGYIGARAFINEGKTIKDIFFLPTTASADVLSTKQFELTPEYNEFASDQKIYVKESVVDGYKAAWADYASQINYQIPFKSDNTTPVIATRFGTFSREFDVDISDNNLMTASGKPAVVAYTGMIEKVTNDKGTFIRMSSINCGASDGTDGTYIPANTGVLLEGNVYNAAQGVSQSPADFTYYKIGEKAISAPENNIMACVTERSRTIKGAEDGYYNYIISQGKYWSLDNEQEEVIPAHKSYMHIPSSSVSNSKRIVMLFGDDLEDNPTAIIMPHHADNATPAVYDLAGRRVSGSPSRGVYIVNGKKYVR